MTSSSPSPIPSPSSSPSLLSPSRSSFWSSLLPKAKKLFLQTHDFTANLSNLSALIYHSLRSTYGTSATNWVGFYLLRPVSLSSSLSPHDLLVLGPFHGNPAVSHIRIGNGVCGSSISLGSTQLVPNVHLFPGHIACDSASNSEIVIPIPYENNSIPLSIGEKERQTIISQIQIGLKGKVIFFCGLPGSGKGTQGKILQHLLRIPHVSTGELFRVEADKKTEIGLEMAKYMDKGAIIPSKLTFDYLEKEFSHEKYRNGFILDGYPKNLECFEFVISALKKQKLSLLSVLHFDIHRDEAKKRLTERLLCPKCEKSFRHEEMKYKERKCDECQNTELIIRKDDNPQAIEKRLEAFEKSTIPLLPYYRDMGVLHQIKVPNTPEEMTDNILLILKNAVERDQFLNSLPQSSYYSRPFHQDEKENSSVFHNHIDAKDHLIVKKIVDEITQHIASTQHKIYPISHLMKGPQMAEKSSSSSFSDVYKLLPNFHTISDAKHEAFATGKMGSDCLNYSQILFTLQVAFSHPNSGVMTEIEEELLSYDVGDYEDCNGDLPFHYELDRGDSSYQMDWTLLPQWKEKMIPHVPKYELHHGFDLEKVPTDNTPPISLSSLMSESTANGLCVGGWFIFSKQTMWSYRCNEFSDDSYGDNVVRLKGQSLALHKLVRKLLNREKRNIISQSASLEKVHAIWKVPDTELPRPSSRYIGVLDIDNPEIGGLTEEDVTGLQNLLGELQRHVDWSGGKEVKKWESPLLPVVMSEEEWRETEFATCQH